MRKRSIGVHPRASAVSLVCSTLLFCLAASAQTRLTLQQAGSRLAPDWIPTFEGKQVIVKGQVSSKPLWAVDTWYLPIQDADEYGLLVQGPAAQFANFAPGNWIEVQGTLVRRAGLPVLLPHEIKRVGNGAPPAPKFLKVADLAQFRYLGVLVAAEST